LEKEEGRMTDPDTLGLIGIGLFVIVVILVIGLAERKAARDHKRECNELRMIAEKHSAEQESEI
jgi:hypothetical protein